MAYEADKSLQYFIFFFIKAKFFDDVDGITLFHTSGNLFIGMSTMSSLLIHQNISLVADSTHSSHIIHLFCGAYNLSKN